MTTDEITVAAIHTYITELEKDRSLVMTLLKENDTLRERIEELEQRLGELVQERLLDIDTLHIAQDRIVELEHKNLKTGIGKNQ